MTDSKIYGIIGTVVIHVLIIVLLLCIVLRAPEQYEESGMEVMLGDVPMAKGDLASYRYTEVQATQPVQPQQTPAPKAIENTAPPKEEPIITQNTEKTVDIKTVEKTEAEKKAEAERAEAERKAAAEKAAHEKAASQMANAFGKGNKMEAQGTTEAKAVGTQGTADGSPTAVASGKGGVGASYDLGGRGILGSLPIPQENIQDEGKVVVNITVDAEGNVIDANINLKTTTTNIKLRDAAMKAAKRAKFAPLKESDKQQGTITYNFKLR